MSREIKYRFDKIEKRFLFLLVCFGSLRKIPGAELYADDQPYLTIHPEKIFTGISFTRRGMDKKIEKWLKKTVREIEGCGDEENES